MSRWRTILDALRVPDSFRGNWYGEATNEAGHNAVIGIWLGAGSNPDPAACLDAACGVPGVFADLGICRVGWAAWCQLARQSEGRRECGLRGRIGRGRGNDGL
jgi:hypothetical protein